MINDRANDRGGARGVVKARRATRVRACRWLAAVVCAGLGACSTPRSGADSTAPSVLGAESTPAEAPAVVAIEPWRFENREGTLIQTRSYRLFTTVSGGILVDRLPAFLETALRHYSTSLAPLPAPSRDMETYVFATRPQWARQTQRLLGSEAGPFLQIQRGGFANGGRGIFFDIGPQDTFAVAAHEGWHQYTQVVLRDRLPLWLEEGIATYMEGFRWEQRASDRGVATPRFLPWANLERYDELRAAHGASRLIPLNELLTRAPQELVTLPGGRELTYYAQVWILVHFLREGGSGRHRGALTEILRDAADGRMVQRVQQKLGDRASSSMVMRRRGPELLQAYVSPDLTVLEAEYFEFIERVVAVGSRDRVVAGESPVGR